MSDHTALDIPKAQSSLKPKQQENKRGCLSCVCSVLIWIVVIPIFLYILLATCIRFCCCCCCCATGKTSDAQPDSLKQQLHEAQQRAKKFTKTLQNIRSCLAILSLLWLIVNLYVPGLKNKLIYGSELWKWSLLLAIIACGYTLISPGTRLLLWIFCSNDKFRRKQSAVYFAKGLQRSLNLIVLSGSVLLTWILYFRTSRGIKKVSESDVLLHVVTRSFEVLFAGAVLWLLKNVLLLKWEKDAVYRRLRERILNAGFQFYCVEAVCGSHWELFQPRIKKQRNGDVKMAMDQDKDQNAEEGKATDNDEEKNNESDQKKDAKSVPLVAPGELYEDKTTEDIKEMSNSFVTLSKLYSSREDDGSSHVLAKCGEIIPGDRKNMTTQDLRAQMDDKYAVIFLRILKEEHRSEEISYEDFKRWMVKALKNCLSLGRTLSDAREVVNVLDTVMTTLLIAILIIAWLLLTNIANTEILVLIASPFVGATFIFGNTCKTIFEGIIFSFINHPFDVGDRCIIDQVELEVKRMGILTTTFKMIETGKEALYPNTALASKSIINLKWEPDPNDFVELTLDRYWTKSMLDNLQEKIEEFLEKDEGKRYDKAYTVAIKEIGDSIKITIQYRHVMSIDEAMGLQFQDKRSKQRTQFFLEIKQFMEKIENPNTLQLSMLG